MKRLLVIALCLVILALPVMTSCASYQRPNVAAIHPTKPPELQGQEKAYCNEWAKKESGYDPAGSTVEGAAIGGLLGAGAGAAFGAILGAIVGAPGAGAALGAAAGGLGGGVSGGGSELERLSSLYNRNYALCLQNLGYRTG